jgi:hypothetical protein
MVSKRSFKCNLYHYNKVQALEEDVRALAKTARIFAEVGLYAMTPPDP